MSSPVLFPTKMWKQTLGHDKDAVMKRGHATGLTVGRLNSICSFARYYFVRLMSKELSVLPPNSKSGSFSEPGDSGSSIVDGKDRIAGLMTGGAGDAGVSDYTYVTWINFIRKRMEVHGLYTNLTNNGLYHNHLHFQGTEENRVRNALRSASPMSSVFTYGQVL